MNIKSLDFEHINAAMMNKKRKVDVKTQDTVDITKDVRILSFDMSILYKCCYTGYNYKDYADSEREIKIDKSADRPSKSFPYIKKDKNKFLLDKNFSCKMPYSLILDFIYHAYPQEFSYDSYGNQYTDLFIDVTCKYPYKELVIEDGIIKSEVKVKVSNHGRIKTKVKDKFKTVLDENELREFIDKNGFVVHGERYVYYKRSSSKARRGSTLFVKESFKKVFETWSRMGIEFNIEEEIDPKLSLAGILAYESLDMSHILPHHIYIKPEQILLIDDIKAKSLQNNMYVTRLVGKELQTSIEKIVETNTVTDGQSLLDESIFKSFGYGDKGCCLLRQKMTKSCAFNTRLVEFFKWYYGKEYETKVIKDLLNRDVKVSDIKWIVTPSSFKFFKFENKFPGGKTEAFQVWLDNLRAEHCKFGVCKNEQRSQYGNYQQISYQILQALVLNKDELRELIQDHLEYYKVLRNNDIVFNYFKKQLTYNSSNDFIDNLCAFTNDAQKTVLYRKKKNDCMESYRKKMRKGKILVKDTDYAIVVSDPVTMLYAAVGNKDHFISSGYEIYCNRYSDDQMLFETRNPVVCSANIGYVKNKWYDDYKWFNLTRNIAIITGNGNNFYTKNSGLDMDSDAILISAHPVMVQKAKWCHENFLIPHSEIGQTEEDKKKKQYYTMEQIAMADSIISDNYIGRIINCSQLLNSLWQDYYYQYLEESESDKRLRIKDIMNEISMDIAKCNDISNIEIDKAKRPLSVNSGLELIKIMQKPYIRKVKKIIKKQRVRTSNYNKLIGLENRMKTAIDNDMLAINEEIADLLNEEVHAVIKPKFFRSITKQQPKFEYVPMGCTMDFLQDILDDEFKNSRGESYISISDIFDISEGDNVDMADRRQMKTILSFAHECHTRLRRYNQLSKDERKSAINKDEIIAYFATMMKKAVTMPRDITLKTILIKCFTENKKAKIYSEDYYAVRNTMCTLLFCAYGDILLQCFKHTGNGKIRTLKELDESDNNYDIIVLGKRYKYIDADVRYSDIDVIFQQKIMEIKNKSA